MDSWAEGDKMCHNNLFLGSVFVVAVLVAPLATRGNATPPQINVQVYDRGHHDYHEWNSREAHYYEQYRKEHPKLNVNFSRTSRSQQREYWNWRHSQPDRD
jgi:hypothetical protein